MVEKISERHRHRYGFNNEYEAINQAGLQIVGVNEEKNLVEIVELKDHPFCRHPISSELKSAHRPHPLFVGLMKAALK